MSKAEGGVDQLPLVLLHSKYGISSLKLTYCTLSWEEDIVNTIFLKMLIFLFCVKRFQQFSAQPIHQLVCHMW